MRSYGGEAQAKTRTAIRFDMIDDIEAEISAARKSRAMKLEGSAARVWRDEGAFVAPALAFAAATVWLGLTVPQFNDVEAVQTANEAISIAAGFHRWGLLEYTHHPIGRAYLLLPLVYGGLEAYFIFVPILVAAACGGLALWALLRRAPTWPLRVAVLGMFAALLAQPGYAGWVGNLHQHSYNMSSILLLVCLCVQIERARWLALTAFLFGWIGYDFFFAQTCTVFALRLAFWNERRDARPFEQMLAAVGDTAAFLIGFLSATLLHYVQNVLYFSSAVMAYHDLFGSLAVRIDVQPHTSRLAGVAQLVRDYVGKFLAADRKWSHPASLAAASAVLGVAGLHGLVRRLRTPDRRPRTGQLWNALVALLVLAGAVGTILVWFYAAPYHAAPHKHLFPRMLLIPFLVATAGLVLLLSPERPGGAASARRNSACVTLAAVLAAVNWVGPAWSAAAIDARFYDRTWTGTVDVADATLMAGPLLPATPAASSVAESYDLDGPLKVKKKVWMVGHINFWGSDLDNGPGLRWAPADLAGGWYEQRFAGPARVTDVAIRLWGLPRQQGIATPKSLVLSAVEPDGTAHPIRRYPDPLDPPVLQGKYIVFHDRFDPPVRCAALRLDFDRTVGGGPPVLLDFQAFGTLGPS